MHAHHPETQGVIHRQCRKSMQGKGDGDVGFFGELPQAPALSITDRSFKDRYLECSKELTDTRKSLEEILASKRWKIGSMIGSPYRAVKRFLSG